MFLFLVLIVGAFGLVVFGGVIEKLAASFLGQSESLLLFFALFRWLVIVLFVLTGFAVIYYFGPDRKQELRLFSPRRVCDHVTDCPIPRQMFPEAVRAAGGAYPCMFLMPL